jgi:hypothetical protein
MGPAGTIASVAPLSLTGLAAWVAPHLCLTIALAATVALSGVVGRPGGDTCRSGGAGLAYTVVKSNSARHNLTKVDVNGFFLPSARRSGY